MLDQSLQVPPGHGGLQGVVAGKLRPEGRSREQCRDLPTGGVAPQNHAFRIPAIVLDVGTDPCQRGVCVLKHMSHVETGWLAVVDVNHHHPADRLVCAVFGQGRFVSGGPASAMEIDVDGKGYSFPALPVTAVQRGGEYVQVVRGETVSYVVDVMDVIHFCKGFPVEPRPLTGANSAHQEAPRPHRDAVHESSCPSCQREGTFGMVDHRGHELMLAGRPLTPSPELEAMLPFHHQFGDGTLRTDDPWNGPRHLEALS